VIFVHFNLVPIRNVIDEITVNKVSLRTTRNSLRLKISQMSPDGLIIGTVNIPLPLPCVHAANHIHTIFAKIKRSNMAR
jgi:hypothetical protein